MHVAYRSVVHSKQGVALTGRNTVTRLVRHTMSAARPPTCPAVGAPTVHAPGGRPAGPTAGSLTDDDKTDDDRRQRAKQ